MAARGRPARGVVHFLGSLIIATIVAAGTALVTEPRYALLIGPLTLSVTSTAWAYLATHRLDAEQTRGYARREDLGRDAIHVVVIFAAVGSLAAVAVALFTGDPTSRLVDSLLALFTVFASWAMIHMMYAARYARVYYSEPEGGIDSSRSRSTSYSTSSASDLRCSL